MEWAVDVNEEIRDRPTDRPTNRADVIVRLFDFIFPGQRTNRCNQKESRLRIFVRCIRSVTWTSDELIRRIFRFMIFEIFQMKEMVSHRLSLDCVSHLPHHFAIVADNGFH